MCISEFGKSGLILLWNPFITVQTFTYPSFLRWWNGYFQSIRIFGYNFLILNICVDISWAGKFHYIFFQVEARMPFSRVNGFDLCGLKLSSLAELNSPHLTSPQLCFVFLLWSKATHQNLWHHNERLSNALPVLLLNSVFNSLRNLQAWLKITLFGFNSRWMDTLKDIWKHLVCRTVSLGSLYSSEQEVSERGRENFKHPSLPVEYLSESFSRSW